ncbi:beta-galactosidase [Schumannella luteola]
MKYGGDYNPEQWPEEVWAEDVRLMREAGVTIVSLGIFSWSRIQPAEGVFDFEWLDRVIDLLHGAGIEVDLATATASPPPWAHEAYPEMLPRTAEGTVLGPGSRQHFAPTSPVYRRLASELVRAIAERYAQHPAVVLWHVNNEYGCHLNYDYSDNAAVAFRAWLEARYGSVEELNRAWGTDFWSQRYTSFAQVLPPRAAPYSHNPAQLLDFRRFTSDALLECYLMEKQIIRDAGATQPITTNFMGAFPPADYWSWAPHMDVITDDCYPDPNDPESFRDAAFARDLMRSLGGGKPWLLLEQSTNALNWRPSNAPKAPGQMAALSMQAVGRGADGILFFQWRQSRSGAEKFHSAMLPHAGTDTRTWREVVALGHSLAGLPALPDPTPAEVAIVLDWEAWWALSSPDHPVVLDYLELVKDWYRAAHEAHVQVDFVAPGVALDAYRVVVAPNLYLLRSSFATALTRFAEGGGHLVVGPFSDVVDEHDAFRDGGYLTQLGRSLGIRVEDFGALQIDPALPGQSTAPVRFGERSFVGRYLAEEIHAVDAEVVGTFEGGRCDGRPAVTRCGTAWYVATHPGREGAAVVLDAVLAGAGVEPLVSAGPLIEAADRGGMLTLINHGDSAERVEVTGTLLSGEAVTSVELAPFEVALLRR